MRAGNVGFINGGRVGRGASPALREGDNSRVRRFMDQPLISSLFQHYHTSVLKVSGERV